MRKLGDMTLCMLRDDLFLFVRCLVPKVCAPLSLRRYLLQPLLSSSFIFNFKVHFYNSRWVVLLQKRKKGDRQFKCAHFNNMEAGIFFFFFLVSPAISLPMHINWLFFFCWIQLATFSIPIILIAQNYYFEISYFGVTDTPLVPSAMM